MFAFLFDFYHVLFVIFAYSLLNLTVSLIAYYRKRIRLEITMFT